MRKVLSSSVLAALLICGCASDPIDPSSGSPNGSPASAAFPVTIESADGPITIYTRPMRIVSLSPTATEMLFAIGAGDQVVAVDDQSDYPEGVPTTDLSGFEPNIEAIVSYAPDLVVLAGDAGAVVKGLEQLEVPVLVQPAATAIDDSYEQIAQLGDATGHHE